MRDWYPPSVTYEKLYNNLYQGAMELSIAASGYMIATSTAWLIGIGGTTALG